MRAFRCFAALALAGLLFAGILPVAAAENGPPPGYVEEEVPPPFVEGRIEQAGVNGILVNGRYYYIDDAVVMDGDMKRLGKDALVEGAKVTLSFDGAKVRLITVSGKAAE